MEILKCDKVNKASTQLTGEGDFQVSLDIPVILALKYLKDDALNHLRSSIDGFPDIEVHHIKWIITVPVMWREPDIQFMRECCISAGLTDVNHRDRVEFLAESDSAAFAALNLHSSYGSVDHTSIKVGDSILIADCGGGTFDLSSLIIKNLSPLSLDVMSPSSGDRIGSTNIDVKFLRFLFHFLGDKCLKMARNDNNACVDMEINLSRLAEYEFHILSSWETFKTSAFKSESDSFLLRFDSYVPDIMRQCGTSFEERCNAFNAGQPENKKLVLEKMGTILRGVRLPFELIRSFFKESVDGVVNLLSDYLKRPEVANLKFVILAGGFSNSFLIIKEVEKLLASKRKSESLLQLMRLNAPHLAVSAGGALYALLQYQQEISDIDDCLPIQTTMSSKYYGITAFSPYDESNPEHKARESGSRIDCYGLKRIEMLSIFVRANEHIPMNGITPRRKFTPAKPDCTSVMFEVFSSDKELLPYRDMGWKSLGNVVVPVDTSIPFNERSYDVELDFRKAEKRINIFDSRDTSVVLKYGVFE